MTEENAIITAASAAKMLDMPAYVWQDNAWRDTYQVACVHWGRLNEEQRNNTGHIVFPDGAIFSYTRHAPTVKG